ncbi:MAG: hypothetical protein AAF958_12140 [Planctomycetota bacterium]
MSPQPAQSILDAAEYVEQGYLFQLLRQRHEEQLPMQELLEQVRYELLTTTKLPLAVDFLSTELKHSGQMAPAMYRLAHYFTPFQSFLVAQAEREAGRFTMGAALQILEGEAKYRGAGADRQGMFFFHFEAICRNRLSYDKGLTAVASDPLYDTDWAKWILKFRAEIGLIDLSDLLFFASEEFREQLVAAGRSTEGKGPFLFGRKEGRIAFGNRRKDPLYLFAAMQRHLGYPEVPRPKPLDQSEDLIPQMARRIQRLESRLRLLEDERRGGIDITNFYEKENPPK